MPRQVDGPEYHLVLAPPPAESVSPEQLREFFDENPRIRSWGGHFINTLSRVPAERWARISNYLRINWTDSSTFTSFHISILTKMSIERLDAVLPFVNANHITNDSILNALSVITADSLDDFKTLLQEKDIMKDGFPFIFAHMPKDKWSAFSTFIRRNQFDENIRPFGMVYAKHSEENWERLLQFTKGKEIYRYMSETVIRKLAEMSPEDSMDYLTFLNTNQIEDWHAIIVLVDLSVDKRERLWAFATEHHLVDNIGSLAEISDEQWDVVTRFVLKYPGTKISPLASLTVEQWDAFECFVSQHQITDAKWIAEFAEVPADMRENLFIYQQKYHPKTHQIDNCGKISSDLWPQFMATINQHGITNPTIINELADANPNEWEELASFIVQKNIDEYYAAHSLINAPETRYRALLAFVEQFNIQNQDIIRALAEIPVVQQWENLLRVSQPLFQAPLNPGDQGLILQYVYEITIRQYRIERAMPVYGEAERQGRIAYALAEIANGRMPQHPEDYKNRLEQILKTPLNQRLNMRLAAEAGATAIEMHAEGRDDATTTAMRLFKQLPYDLTHVNDDYEAFIAYVNAFPRALIKTCAQMVLGLYQLQRTAESFGPMGADLIITSHELDMTGREFFARLWHFIHHGDFIGIDGDEALNKDRENARVGLIQNIANAYEEGQIICNPGKIQHIVGGVLQGRLKGVHLDKEIPITETDSTETAPSPEQEKTILTNTVAASLRDFLQAYEPVVNSQQALRAHVEAWLQSERGLQGPQIEVYRRQFQNDLDSYLTLSDLPEHDADLEEMLADTGDAIEVTDIQGTDEVLEDSAQQLVTDINLNQFGFFFDPPPSPAERDKQRKKYCCML